MWTAALPLTSAAAAAAATARRHLVIVGRREISTGDGSDAQKQELSGSDVLIALQRATDNKSKAKAAAAAATERGRRRGNQQHSSTATANNKSVITVKPLFINPQWAHQLEQLETRLHLLPHGSDPHSP